MEDRSNYRKTIGDKQRKSLMFILERHYTSSSFITSENDTGIKGVYHEPANDLSFERFAKTLVSHVGAFV
jgi:hypothetical protein